MRNIFISLFVCAALSGCASLPGSSQIDWTEVIADVDELVDRAIEEYAAKKEQKPDAPDATETNAVPPVASFPILNLALQDVPDNVLLYPGRQISWEVPTKGGNRLVQYESGYIPNFFVKNALARWPGHVELYEFATGDTSFRAGGAQPVYVKCTVHSRITYIDVKRDDGSVVRTDLKGRYDDNGAPASIPDKVSYVIKYSNGHLLKFSHSHSGDAMSVFADLCDPTGKNRVHFPPNHTCSWLKPEAQGGQRLDIRYLPVGKPERVWLPRDIGM